MRASVAVVGLSLLLLAPPASASDSQSAAAAAYARGEELAKAGRLRDAALAFIEADQLAPADAALESALGAAARADDPVLVMTLIDRAEETKRSTLPGLADARARFGTKVGRVEVPCFDEAPPCTGTIDGAALLARSTLVLAGSRRIELAAGARKRSEQITVQGGARVVVELPQPPKATNEASAPQATGISPYWLILGGGLTLGLGGGALATGLLTVSAEDELNEAQARRAGAAEQQEIIDRGDTMALLTNVFLGVSAGCAAATTLVAIFAVDWSPAESDKARATLVPQAGGAVLLIEGSF